MAKNEHRNINIDEQSEEGASTDMNERITTHMTASAADVVSPKGSQTLFRESAYAAYETMKDLKHQGIKEAIHHKMPLQYNELKLVKIDTLSNQLTGAEKDMLNDMIYREKQNYVDTAQQLYDPKNNWSIMMSNDLNEERNDIMRKFKYQSLKKYQLREFARKERDRIVKERNAYQASQQIIGDEQSNRTGVSSPNNDQNNKTISQD